MNLEEAVAALGTTEDSICKVLEAHGIKGQPNKSCSCPIAKYLRGEGLVGATVGRVHASCAGYSGISLPGHVTTWIGKFDEGHYPQFLEVA